MIAIFAAIKQEIRGLVNRMDVKNKSTISSFSFLEGTLGGKEVVLVRTGMGEEKADSAAKYVLGKYPVKLVVSTGVCGGLNEKTNIGDSIIYAAIKCEHDKEKVLYCDTHLLSVAEVKLEKLGQRHMVGIGLTAKAMCALPDAKRELGLRFKADAIDMESYRVAMISSTSKIPFLIIRPVFDTVFEDMTVTERVTGKDKTIDFKGLSYLLVHPGCVKRLIDYGKRFEKIGGNLAEFVCEFTSEI